MTDAEANGPLRGTKVLELAGRGPTPFGVMMLADMGAEVLRLERPGEGAEGADPILRGRASLAVDLKDPQTVECILDVVEHVDVLVEGYRPGVMERLGLGPDVTLARNPRLVYARMTGWGQQGPLAHLAGHDINYIALAGALFPIGREGQPPLQPLNLLGDYGGGGMLLAFGITCALVEARSSGRGQIVDAAMYDGAALLTTGLHGAMADGSWNGVRGTNLLDSGAPFYNVYETADGRHVAVGALEGRFYKNLVTILGLPRDVTADRMDRSRWPLMRTRFAEAFRERTQAQWCEAFEGIDACFSPVLAPGEAVRHRHATNRRTFRTVEGIVQPSPAPRFSRTPAADATPAGVVDSATTLLERWGVEREVVDGFTPT